MKDPGSSAEGPSEDPSEDPWTKLTLDGLERKNVWVVFLAVGAAWYFLSGKWAVSVFLGGVLGIFNLRGLRRSLETFFFRADRVSLWFIVASAFRFFMLVTLIALAVLVLPVNLLALALGLSTVVGAALAQAVAHALRGDSEVEVEEGD